MVFQASFKHPPKKTLLRTAKCFYGISLFTDYHQGEPLEAIVLHSQLCGFLPTNIIFLLGDSPQAYNLSMKDPSSDPDSSELRTAADKLGDSWLEQNQSLLEKTQIRVVRWRDILNKERFKIYQKKVHDLYSENSSISNLYREAIEDTSHAVFKRFSERTNFSDKEWAKNLCTRFVLEECAVFIYLALEENFNFMAYPSPIPSAVYATKHYFIDPYAHGRKLLQWLQITLKSPSLRLSPTSEPKGKSFSLFQSLEKDKDNESTSSEEEEVISSCKEILLGQIDSFVTTLKLNSSQQSSLLSSLSKDLKTKSKKARNSESTELDAQNPAAITFPPSSTQNVI